MMKVILYNKMSESVRPSSGRAQVYMAGSYPDQYWFVDETYDQVIEKIYIER